MNSSILLVCALLTNQYITEQPDQRGLFSEKDVRAIIRDEMKYYDPTQAHINDAYIERKVKQEFEIYRVYFDAYFHNLSEELRPAKEATLLERIILSFLSGLTGVIVGVFIGYFRIRKKNLQPTP